MKKYLYLLVFLLSLLPMTAHGAEPEIRVSVDGKVLEFDVPPQIIDGRTLVPFRGIFEALGSDVDWDAKNKVAIGIRGNIRIKLPIGQTVAYKNEQPIKIDVAAMIIDGRTFVPVRFIAESLGAMVNWDASNKTVIIKEMGEKKIVKDSVAYVAESGGIYTGEMQNDRPNGTGTFKFYDSNPYKALLYKGEFKNGRMVGEGVFEWKNGDKYIGTFNNNQKHGKGTLYFGNGDVYEGNWENDLYDGPGVMTYANGDRYEGEWQVKKYHGQGTLTYANGDQYKGQWREGLKEGTGVMTYVNGDRYEGEWQDGLASGKGTMIYGSGDKYEGEWKKGLKNGRGTYTTAAGKVMNGTWEEDKLVDWDSDWIVQ